MLSMNNAIMIRDCNIEIIEEESAKDTKASAAFPAKPAIKIE